jgi:hypothetical protein
MAEHQQVGPHVLGEAHEGAVGARRTQLAGAERGGGAGDVAVREIDDVVAGADHPAAELGRDGMQECAFGAGAEIAGMEDAHQGAVIGRRWQSMAHQLSGLPRAGNYGAPW